VGGGGVRDCRVGASSKIVMIVFDNWVGFEPPSIGTIRYCTVLVASKPYHIIKRNSIIVLFRY
jgi:hypothetical protein